jgi:hypothetical protein
MMGGRYDERRRDDVGHGHRAAARDGVSPVALEQAIVQLDKERKGL